MSRPTRYTYLVTIEQLPWSSEKQPYFGSIDDWAEVVRKSLYERLQLAEVVAVKPAKPAKSTEHSCRASEDYRALARHHNEKCTCLDIY